MMILVLIYAAAFVVGLLAIRFVIEIAPVDRSRREAARRAMPVLAWAAALAFALLSVQTLLSEQPIVAAVAMVVVVAGFALASAPALRDVTAGVFLKAGQICREGDHVRAGDLEGRVAHMGLRVMVLETREGEEAIIPYGRLSRERLIRAPSLDAVSPHVFRLRLPDGGGGDFKARIRRRALLCHWAAVSRDPEFLAIDGHLEVTVYAIDPDRGPDIEAAIRADLEGPDEHPERAPASEERKSRPPREVLG
jgi:hypothetical protein